MQYKGPSLIAALMGVLLATAHPSVAEVRGAPDILVLGDSQLSFGAGQAFVDLFGTLRGDCGLAQDTSIGVIGVRSSALQSWTATSRTGKGAICDVDPTWKVNAGTYGTLAQADSPFVQIGRGDQFQFCSPERSPLRAVFHGGYYRPRLLIMFLMGNAAERWAQSAVAAEADVRSFVSDLPAEQPCIFMTSAPPYGAKEVRLRQRAQDHVEAAFAKFGARCSFVPGFTPQTIAENQGNARNFRRRASGRVKDPYHPTEAGARRFLALQRKALCRAIEVQLAP